MSIKCVRLCPQYVDVFPVRSSSDDRSNKYTFLASGYTRSENPRISCVPEILPPRMASRNRGQTTQHATAPSRRPNWVWSGGGGGGEHRLARGGIYRDSSPSRAWGPQESTPSSRAMEVAPMPFRSLARNSCSVRKAVPDMDSEDHRRRLLSAKPCFSGPQARGLLSRIRYMKGGGGRRMMGS